MMRLVHSLIAFGGCIEADFQSEYSLSLWHTLAGGEWGRVHRLTLQLGADSRFSTAASALATRSGGGEKPDVTEWARTDRLLASVVDELAVANWQRGNGKGKKPELLTAKRRKRVLNDLSMFDQADVLAALRASGPQREES